MSDPIRRISAPHRPGLDVTAAGERPPRAWRYSSKLALALSGGGARAAYQVGIIDAITERLPELELPILTGVSAGAINTSFLAAHPGPLRVAVHRLREQWLRLTPERVFRVRPVSLVRSAARWSAETALGRRTGPTVVRGLLDAEPLREFLKEVIDFRGIDANILAGRLRAVALSATSFTTGRSVTFVHGAPDVPTWERVQRVAVRSRLAVDHVLASSAIPILFPAVRLEGEFYGDGSVRQTAPLAPAIHLGARAVLAIGMRTNRASSQSPPPLSEYPSAAEAVGLLFDSIFLDVLEADAERLERVNRLLTVIPADVPAPDGLKPVDLLMLRPSRDLGTLAAGKSAVLPKILRFVVGGMGGLRAGASEFLSYLLFDPAYTSQLMELGYEDAGAYWPAIEEFFAKMQRTG